jgi:hypothetical protein
VDSSKNWLRRLEKSENKSRNITTGRSLRLSSIDGWTADKLPKLLIVWNFKKTCTDAFPSLTRPGKFSKKRDIEAIVDSYEMYLITKEDASVVPWEYKIRHSDLVRLDWTQEWHDELKIVASDLNRKYYQRPINFQLSFKNGTYLRLQYQISDYTKLPKCPPEVAKILSPHLDTLIGIKFRLKKDHTSNGGKSGWYDNEMGKWENENNMKASGTLYVKRPGFDWEAYPSFSEGKQDYWTGFAIDYLISHEIPHFIDRGGHETGVDHTLDFIKEQKSLHDFIPKNGKKKALHKRVYNKIKRFMRQI